MAIKKSEVVGPPEDRQTTIACVVAAWEKIIDRGLKAGSRRFIWTSMPTPKNGFKDNNERNGVLLTLETKYREADWTVALFEIEVPNYDPPRWPGDKLPYRKETIGWEFS